jgi:hypothetical protein
MSKDYLKIVTPAGIAIYPHLTQPDFKFNPLGQYKVDLSLTEDEAAPLIAKFDEVMEEAKRKVPPGKPLKIAEPPYHNELDDEGQETGRVIFRFTMKAKFNTKDGRTIEMSPKLFDAQGTLMTDVDSIWGGSKLRISSALVPYHVPARGAGVSMRLQAVQIIELKTGGGGADASNYGFEATEGFTAPQEETAQVQGFEIDDEDF